MWDSRCIDSKSSTPDLAASQFLVYSFPNQEHFCSLSCVTRHPSWDMNVDSMHKSRFYREAFGHLLLIIIFRPLAVNPPHSGTTILSPCDPPALCGHVTPTVQLLSCKLSLSSQLFGHHPVLSPLTTTEESNVLHPSPDTVLSCSHMCGGHDNCVQTQSSLSQLRKHHIVTTWQDVYVLLTEWQ